MARIKLGFGNLTFIFFNLSLTKYDITLTNMQKILMGLVII